MNTSLILSRALFRIASAASDTATNNETDVANTASETSAIIQESVNKIGVPGLNPYLVKGISIGIVVLVTFVICRIIHHIVTKFVFESSSDKITGSQVTHVNILYNVVKFIIIIFSTIVILDIVGINITGLVAGLGVVGAIAGLAAQDLLKDFIAGTNIASEHYFAIGDVIECQNYIGTVTALSMRSTKLKTVDGSIVTIQNHLIDKARVLSDVNTVKVQLPYDYDRDKAYELMDTIVQEVKNIPEITDAESAGISSFEDSAILYMIVFHCPPMDAPRVTRKVNDITISVLDKAGVEIPFTQIDIHQK